MNEWKGLVRDEDEERIRKFGLDYLSNLRGSCLVKSVVVFAVDVPLL